MPQQKITFDEKDVTFGKLTLGLNNVKAEALKAKRKDVEPALKSCEATLTQLKRDQGKGLLQSRITAWKGIYDQFNGIVATLAKKVDVEDEGDEDEGDKEVEITYASTKVESACSGSNVQTKIKSVASGSDKGHGPVALLSNANHTHVTNQDGIAYRWTKPGKTLQIVSYGKKNDKAPKGSCGYDWVR